VCTTLLALLPDVPGDVVPEDLNRLLRFHITEMTRGGIHHSNGSNAPRNAV
jgi:hypothetical protein